MADDKTCNCTEATCRHVQMQRDRRLVWLMKSSILLCCLWLGTALISSFAINANLTDVQAGQTVSEAEHERLRAEMEKNDEQIISTEKILEQRVYDDERQIAINTALLQDIATTIHRAEGLGLSFGLVITIVQFAQWQAHKESQKRVRATDLME